MLLYTYISRFSVTPTISNPAELPPPTLFPNRSSLRFQLLSQMAHVCFHRRKWVHTRLSEKDRTQGHTRRNRGRFGRGRYHYPRHELHIHEHPRAGYQNGKFCRFWGLVGGAPEERRKPTGQRCAYARRCPVGVAAPLGCVILFLLSKLWLVCHALRVFPRVRDMGGITTLGVLCVLPKRRTAACQSG